MKREDITAILPDISKEQLDRIMDLHGSDITALRGQLTAAQNDLTAANQKLEGYDPEWQTKLTQAETNAQAQLSAWKREAAIDAALASAGARNAKAARALLDLDKVQLGEDGKLEGLSDQLEALGRSDSWLFAPGGTQQAGTGMTTGGEHGQGGSAEQDGVTAAFARLNPGLKL